MLKLAGYPAVKDPDTASGGFKVLILAGYPAVKDPDTWIGRLATLAPTRVGRVRNIEPSRISGYKGSGYLDWLVGNASPDWPRVGSEY